MCVLHRALCGAPIESVFSSSTMYSPVQISCGFFHKIYTLLLAPTCVDFPPTTIKQSFKKTEPRNTRENRSQLFLYFSYFNLLPKREPVSFGIKLISLALLTEKLLSSAEVVFIEIYWQLMLSPFRTVRVKQVRRVCTGEIETQEKCT